MKRCHRPWEEGKLVLKVVVWAAAVIEGGEQVVQEKGNVG